MKRLLLTLSFIAITTSLFAQDIQLLPPNTKGGKPLMQALSERKSSRVFSEKGLNDQQLSDLLWAANGVNRQEKTGRTAPSASNSQEIDTYVFLEKGIYLYNAEKHVLILKKEGDFRKEAGKQPFVATAAVCLTFVGNFDKMPKYSDEQRVFYSATDCGFVSQNVYLYCASEGLSTVVLGMVDKDKVSELLELKNAKVILSQVVGFPKN